MAGTSISGGVSGKARCAIAAVGVAVVAVEVVTAQLLKQTHSRGRDVVCACCRRCGSGCCRSGGLNRQLCERRVGTSTGRGGRCGGSSVGTRDTAAGGRYSRRNEARRRCT
jgi:hypothetical protein